MPKIKYDIQIFQNKKYGGIATYFIELQKSIKTLQGHNFEVYQDGFLTSNPSVIRNGIFPILFKSRVTKRVARFINEKYSRFPNCDLTHSTYYMKSFLDSIDPSTHIVTIHDMIPDDFPEYFKDEYPHEDKFQYLRSAAGIICVSEYTKSRLMAHCPWIDKEKIQVIYHGSKYDSTETIPKIDAATNVRVRQAPTRKMRLLYVGSRFLYKNFEILVKAGELLKESKIEFEILCVGGGGFTQNELELFAEADLLGEITQREATNSQLKNIYSSSSCQITTSNVEGFGLPLLEAMSLGCPTLISQASALHEISGGNSLPFDENDTFDLAEKILAISTDQSLRTELIFGGLERSRFFSWEKAASETLSFYETILASR